MLTPVLISAPIGLPVLLEEMKRELRLDHGDDDQLVQSLIAAATNKLETRRGLLGEVFLTQTWRMDLAEWPCDVIELPLRPVQSVLSVTYRDKDNAAQTLAASKYIVYLAATPPYIGWSPSVSLPSLYARDDAISVTFIAGYGQAKDVPEAIRRAIILDVKREYEPSAENLPAIERSYNALVSQYKTYGF